MKKPKGPDHPSGPLFFSPDHITQDLFLSSFINAGECIFDSEIWTVYGNIYLLAHNNKFCNLLNEYILLDFDLCLYLLIPFQL